jgi:metal-dependent HD superfamily phosphatase/phosphodiesterase
VALNAITIIDLLGTAGVKLNLEKEDQGTFEDSKIVVIVASFLHDLGMTVGREGHEHLAAVLAMPILDRVLGELYKHEPAKKLVLRSLIIEAIIGHMGTQKIHSLEAGILLIADGCDLEQGRARIPMLMTTESRVGDIHKYSSSAVEKVEIAKGKKRPVRITVKMKESVGFFQVEEILHRKIDASPVKPFVELYAGVTGQKIKQYL